MAIYFFDKNQTLIKIAPDSATFEAIQTQELDDDSLLKDTLSVTVKGDEKLLNAEYMAVKSYTGNAQAFDMYRIVTDTTPDKSMSFTGMSLAPYELNGHIIQDLRPANHSLNYTLNRVLDGTDWRVGYIDDGLSNVTTTFYYVSAKEALKELQSLVGCEFVFKVEISGQKITDKWVEVYKEMGNRTKKRFNYGTNALTVVRETNKADIYTALIGRGKGEEISSAEENESGQAGYGRKITFEDIEWSIAKGNPLDKPKGQYYLELPQATQVYGIKNIDGTMSARVGIVEFDDEEDKNRLINLTYQQLLVSSRPKVLFKTTVANIGATGIGDTVTIHRHDLGIHYQTRVRKIVRNKLNDNKTQIELGDAVVTASTKRVKENNATIKNLTQELEKVKDDVTTSQTSADGKNTIFYGSKEPERQRTGDTWYRPHPSIAGETQMLVWNGTAWELVVDSSDLTSVAREVEAAIEEAGKAVQSAKDADTKANDALVKAGANANLLTTHQNTIDTINTVTLPDIASSAGTALTNAKDAMDEAKKADDKIADYVTKNGLVSGTTVDSKIDTAKGEITAKLTELETSKLDSTTYTNFYENDYKRTAKGVTDAWIAVNKIVDENGNTTDTFAKAVYDRNATRQSADFKSVTDGLVKTATYESGINGVKQSITSVEGKIDGLQVGGRNLLLNSSDLVLEAQPRNSGTASDNYNFAVLKLDLKKDTQYTLSFELEKLGLDYSSVSIYTQHGHADGQIINLTNSPRQHITFTAVADTNTNITYIYAGVAGSTARRGIRLSKIKLEKGSIHTDWSPAPEDMLGQADFQIFKGTYEANDKNIKARLLAVDSGKEGSIAYRLNATESTASGNETTISNIKTKPGEQIAGYQTIKERSDLYERVIGSSSEEGVKQNVARIVMTDSLFQTKVYDINNGVANNLLRNAELKNLDYWTAVLFRLRDGGGSFLIDQQSNLWGYFRQDISVSGGEVVSASLDIRLYGGDNSSNQYLELNALDESGKQVANRIVKPNTAIGWGVLQNIKIEGFKLPTTARKLVFTYSQNAGRINGSFSKPMLNIGYTVKPFSPSMNDKANYSEITQLADNINLKVSKTDLLSQINVQAGGVLITSGTNKLNITPTTTYIQDATIKSAMIESLKADKIKTGTLDAGKVKVINIDAENITSNKTSFVQSAWNGINNTVSINANGIRSANTNGDWTLYHSGAVSFGNSSSQGIYLEYADGSRNGLAINNRGATNTEITLDLVSSARNTMNFGRRTDTNGYDFRIDHYQGHKVSFDGRGVQRYTFNVNSDAQSHAISILGHGATSGYNSGSGLSIGMETADGITKGSRFYFSSNSDLVWLGKNNYSDLKPLAVFDLQFRWGENERKSLKAVLEYLSRASGVDINNIPSV